MLQSHRITYHLAHSFKEFIQEFRTKEYRACFLDIDIQVSFENLEKFISIMSKLKTEDESFRCTKVYCLFCKLKYIIINRFIARDVDKNRTKFLQRNQVYCIKKPVQASLLDKIIKRLKNTESEYVLSSTSKGGHTNNQCDSIQMGNIPVKEGTGSNKATINTSSSHSNPIQN